MLLHKDTGKFANNFRVSYVCQTCQTQEILKRRLSAYL